MQLCLALLGLLLVSWTRGDTANPFEQFATGALNMGGQLLDTLQDGRMAAPQLNFDTPLLSVHSKSQLGFGNAMRRQGDDASSSESDERRKRRRRRSLAHNNHRLLHRKRRAPCFKMMTSATTEASDDVEARKKRAKKRAAANNAARSRIVRKVMKKKKLHEMQPRRRRRRQAEDQGQGQGQKLGPSLGDRVKGLWMSFLDNVLDVAQQMRERIKAAAAQAPSSSN